MDERYADIRTPPRGFSLVAPLLSGRSFPAFLARLGIRRALSKGGPLRLGRTILAVRHIDISEMLRRDLDFVIAPINAERINAVNGGPFILGMDRSPALILEREALYGAMAKLDLSALGDTVKADAMARLASAGHQFDAIADFARPVATATALAVFGIKPEDRLLFAEVVRAIFAHTFLNIGGDKVVEARALAAAPLMQEWFAAEITRRRQTGALGNDLMGQLLSQAKIDDDAVRRALGGMLVGSIDTTTSTFAKILCILADDALLAAEMRERWRAGSDIYGLCLDALRLWPHNPILMRKAAVDTVLGGVAIKAGERVIAWTEAAMQDPGAFPDPQRVLPDRPMASYLHFGAGLHPCAGRAINAIQIPILIGLLLDAGGQRRGKIGWAGPFPNTLPVTTEPFKARGVK
jgi:cytochrome P450